MEKLPEKLNQSCFLHFPNGVWTLVLQPASDVASVSTDLKPVPE